MDIDLLVRYIYIPFIVKICTDELTCSLRCDYDFLWQTNSDEIMRFQTDPINYVPDYVPSIVLQNASEVEVEKVPGASGNPFEIKDGLNFVRFKVKGVFIQHFNLLNFPFDVQNIDIYCTLSFYNAKQVRFVAENQDTDTMIVLTDFTGIKDWTFLGCKAFSYVEDDFAILKSTIYVARIPWSFLLRDVLLVAIITLASLTCFGISFTDTGSRLSLLATLLLTLAAFQLVVSQNLPSLPLLTLADKYLITSFLFNFGLMVLVAISPYMYDDDASDRVLFYAFASCFVLYHVIFSYWGHSAYRVANIPDYKVKTSSAKVFPRVSRRVSSRGLIGIQRLAIQRDSARSMPDIE